MVTITEYLLQEQADNEKKAIASDSISKKDIYSLYKVDSEIAITKFTLLGNKMIVPDWLWRDAAGDGFMHHLNPKAHRTLVSLEGTEGGKPFSSFAEYLKRRHYARLQVAPPLSIHTALHSLDALTIEAKIDCRTFKHWTMIETQIKTQKERSRHELSASVRAFLQGVVWAEEKLLHRQPYKGIHASYNF